MGIGRKIGTGFGCRVRLGCFRKNNKRDCCKVLGNRCFLFGVCGRKYREGWVERDGGKRKKSEIDR